VFWAVLFLLGYVVATIGAATILYRPVTTIMTEPSEYGHADLREDQVWAALVVTIGYAVLWPLTLGLYALARSVAAAAE
jgi:hypothetical protein